jgi:hypothetical protein
MTRRPWRCSLARSGKLVRVYAHEAAAAQPVFTVACAPKEYWLNVVSILLKRVGYALEDNHLA